VQCGVGEYGEGCVCLQSKEPRGSEEKDKKNDVPTYLFFWRLFEIFRFYFCCVSFLFFYGVCAESLMQRNSQKRDPKEANERKKVFSVSPLNFLQNVFELISF
jgi:hypothetical protein